MEDALTALARINLDDLVGAFGLQSHPHLRSVARAVFDVPARAFARQMLDFDARTGERGLADWLQAVPRNRT